MALWQDSILTNAPPGGLSQRGTLLDLLASKAASLPSCADLIEVTGYPDCEPLGRKLTRQQFLSEFGDPIDVYRVWRVPISVS
jgi:hypothetical protein